MVKEFEKRSIYMYENLNDIQGFDVVKPNGAFYCFVDVAALYGKKYNDRVINTAADLAAIMLEEKNVAVVPCQDFGAPDCIRLSYATSMETIEKGLDRIKGFVEELQ